MAKWSDVEVVLVRGKRSNYIAGAQKRRAPGSDVKIKQDINRCHIHVIRKLDNHIWHDARQMPDSEAEKRMIAPSLSDML